MNIEKHRAFLDSLEGEKGLPENFYRLLAPGEDVWKEGDEVYLTNYWAPCRFKTDRFIYKGEKEFVRIFHGAYGWTDLVKNEKVNYDPARRLIESRQIPNLKERVKKFVDAAMEAEGRFWRSSKAAYIDAERGLFRALCATEVKPWQQTENISLWRKRVNQNMKKNKKILIITADTNDADYVTSQNKVTDEDIKKLMPMIEAIKNFKPYHGEWSPGKFCEHSHNFPYGEDLPRDDMGEKSIEELYGDVPGFDLFQELVPFGEYGVHTIVKIEIVYEGEVLFDKYS